MSKTQQKKFKFKKKHNYSDYWLGANSMNVPKQAANTVSMLRLINLSNYHRAVSNFVKILTKKDIPVRFHQHGDSYTDGKSITIGSNTNAKNFDVTVGLALHEASHVLLTDFGELKAALAGQQHQAELQTLMNIIEDRRIDHYVFKNSPGYKAYYHKLYDHYFCSKEIDEALLDPMHRIETVDNYLMHMINMVNPLFDSNALVKLPDIVRLLDLPNIGRLTSTSDTVIIAKGILAIILEAVEKAASTADPVTLPSSSPLRRQLQKQLDHINHSGGGGKAVAAKKLLKGLLAVEKMKVDVSSSDYKSADRSRRKALNLSVINYDFTTDYAFWKKLSTADGVDNCYPSALQTYGYRGDDRAYKHKIQVLDNGMQLGNQLGKKLRLVNETRDTVYNRLAKGRLDVRRMSCLGYGVENVFSQKLISSYKSANIHLSIDISGSMCGIKWNKTMEMIMAIAVAASKSNNKIGVQVSLRGTGKNNEPEIYLVYDSKCNTIKQLHLLLSIVRVTSMTPEGLCFEAMYKKGLIKPTTAEVDSYLINISDGEPSLNGYYGPQAHQHTQTWINKIKQKLGVHVLSYFVHDDEDGRISPSAERGFGYFCFMYGNDAKLIDTNSLPQLAKTLNDKFLSARVNCMS